MDENAAANLYNDRRGRSLQPNLVALGSFDPFAPNDGRLDCGLRIADCELNGKRRESRLVDRMGNPHVGRVVVAYLTSLEALHALI